jgi:predicted CXXCH cytochrome family protein
MRKIALICFLFICNFFLWNISADSKVTGPCSNCHTMHNSQNNSPMAKNDSGNPDTTPNPTLLIYSCLGCHSTTDPGTARHPVTNAPIVYNINGAPIYGAGSQGLAGGNFYWVAQGDDTKGHNVFSSNQDDNLSIAPGRWIGCAGAGDDNSCHKRISTSTNPNQYGFTYPRQGCTKCHMVANTEAPKGYHHLNDSGPVIDSDSEGWHRFLTGHNTGEGVTGIEDDDWQFTYSSNDHNEYLGYSGNKNVAGGFSTLANTMTAYCCGCHGNFHKENPTGSSWIRHPSDSAIPNSGEYASYTKYDPITPVARPDLAGWTGPREAITLESDMVMCLSCHKPHGSAYSDMLRWNYDDMLAGSSNTGGCFNCHSQKRQNP